MIKSTKVCARYKVRAGSFIGSRSVWCAGFDCFVRERWFDEWSDESFTDKFLVWLPKEARNILRKSSMFEDHFQENQSKLLEVFHQSSDLDQHLSLKYLIQITCIWIAISNQLLRLFFTCLQRKISQKTFAWLSPVSSSYGWEHHLVLHAEKYFKQFSQIPFSGLKKL